MEDILVAIGMAPQPQKEYLQQLFKNIPISSRSCRVVKIKADTKFISANDHSNEIWILIDGSVRAIEEQVSGDAYVFTKFQAPKLFGEMEGLAGLSLYKATVVTSTDCQFIILPMENYLNWIRNDSEALFLRTRTNMKCILDQTKKERTYLLLNGIDRLVLFMTKYYREHAEDNTCTIEMNRQQIAEETGFSTKTINRSIGKLSDNGGITKKGREISISERQYEHLLGLLDEKFSKQKRECKV